MPISIGIPFYNAERCLLDAIRSIFAQTYQDWELILVDDGSTDSSLDIAMSVKDPRVRVLTDRQNRKLSHRLNQIVAEARYDFIGRMDADDLISPTRFARQMAILEARPEIDLVTAGVCSITDENVPVGMRCGSPLDAVTGTKLLLGKCAIVHAALLGRKAWFLRNPYDTSQSRAQDYELWLRAFAKNDFNIHIMSDYLYYYREEANVSAERLLCAYRIQRSMYKKYHKLWLRGLQFPTLYAASYCKSGIAKALSAFSKLDILLNHRNSSIRDSGMFDIFSREIKYVLGTRVPGVD